MKIVWSHEAEADLETIWRYIAEDSPTDLSKTGSLTLSRT